MWLSSHGVALRFSKVGDPLSQGLYLRLYFIRPAKQRSNSSTAHRDPTPPRAQTTSAAPSAPWPAQDHRQARSLWAQHLWGELWHSGGAQGRDVCFQGKHFKLRGETFKKFQLRPTWFSVRALKLQGCVVFLRRCFIACPCLKIPPFSAEWLSWPPVNCVNKFAIPPIQWVQDKWHGLQPVFNQILVYCKVLVCFMRLSGVYRGGRGQVFAPGHVQNSRKQLVSMGFYRDVSKRSRAMRFNI